MSERDWQLASEAEDLLRIMPTAAEFKTSSRAVDEWIGRFLAFVDLWRPLGRICLIAVPCSPSSMANTS
jgi:hypothetical protein